MTVYKDGNKWRSVYRYTDWKGEKKQTQKRGFRTKKEALCWEEEQINEINPNTEMTFIKFVELYKNDMELRLKENTWETKKSIIEKNIVPYFKNKKINEIYPKDIIYWQNEMIKHRNSKGNPYSPVYLKTLHNQLSAIFNHGVKFYGFTDNPASKVGSIGKSKNKPKLFWTKNEYFKFITEFESKTNSYYAFEVLYWTGIRIGELLALTPSDFDSDKKTITIDKSYQRIKRKDVITTPKTAKSNRTINLPDFLCKEISEYIYINKVGKSDRMFTITKTILKGEMERKSKMAGVKRISLHCLRHSHISLLIDMGYSAVAIAERVGHESIDITYNYAHMFPSTQIDMAEKLNSIAFM